MKYLITTAYSASQYNLEAPSFVLIPTDDSMQNAIRSALQATTSAVETDSRVQGLRRWAPGGTLWTKSYDDLADVLGIGIEKLESQAENRATIELSDEDAEELDFARVDVRMIETRRNLEDEPVEAYLSARQGEIRVESRAFTLDDLKSTTE